MIKRRALVIAGILLAILIAGCDSPDAADSDLDLHSALTLLDLPDAQARIAMLAGDAPPETDDADVGELTDAQRRDVVSSYVFLIESSLFRAFSGWSLSHGPVKLVGASTLNDFHENGNDGYLDSLKHVFVLRELTSKAEANRIWMAARESEIFKNGRLVSLSTLMEDEARYVRYLRNALYLKKYRTR